MRRQKLAAMLKGGDRRSIGRSNEVTKLVLRQPGRFAELVECLWSEDPIVRMRAADAAEKVSAMKTDLLKPYKRELLGLLAEADQIELRWHLATSDCPHRGGAATRGCDTVTLPGRSHLDCQDIRPARIGGSRPKRTESAGPRNASPGTEFAVGDGSHEGACP